jgi:hypothetical protein
MIEIQSIRSDSSLTQLDERLIPIQNRLDIWAVPVPARLDEKEKTN